MDASSNTANACIHPNQKTGTNETYFTKMLAETTLPKATSIRIEFDDGSILSADESAANNIWSWWQAAQTTAFIHGYDYKGPQLEKTNPRLEEPRS